MQRGREDRHATGAKGRRVALDCQPCSLRSRLPAFQTSARFLMPSCAERKPSGSEWLTFSNSSSSLDSVSRSSSVGLGGMSDTDANCEYVWKRVSVWMRRKRLGQSSCP